MVSAKTRKRRNGSNGKNSPSVPLNLGKIVGSAVESALADYMSQNGGYAPNSQNGIIADTAYNRTNGKSPMAKSATKEPPKANGVHKRLSRIPEARGSGLLAICGRGLSRWREHQGLTVQDAVDKYQIERTAWYRVERGTHELTTARYFDRICEAIDQLPESIILLGIDKR